MFYKKLNIDGTEYPIAVNITGEGAPTTETEADVGMFYMNTADGSVYKCVAEGTWEQLVSKEYVDDKIAEALYIDSEVIL